MDKLTLLKRVSARIITAQRALKKAEEELAQADPHFGIIEGVAKGELKDSLESLLKLKISLTMLTEDAYWERERQKGVGHDQEMVPPTCIADTGS